MKVNVFPDNMQFPHQVQMFKENGSMEGVEEVIKVSLKKVSFVSAEFFFEAIQK